MSARGGELQQAIKERRQQIEQLRAQGKANPKRTITIRQTEHPPPYE
jgi:hypothetical protein